MGTSKWSVLLSVEVFVYAADRDAAILAAAEAVEKADFIPMADGIAIPAILPSKTANSG